MEMFDRIVESISEDYLIDARGTQIFVGDVCAISCGSSIMLGIVKKIYKKAGNYTIIPYDDCKDKYGGTYYYDRLLQKRCYPSASINVTKMFMKDNSIQNVIEENNKLIEETNAKKVSYRFVYGKFTNLANNEYGLCVFKIHSKEGKRFTKDDVSLNLKEIEEKFKNNYSFEWFDGENMVKFDENVKFPSFIVNKCSGNMNEYHMNNNYCLYYYCMSNINKYQNYIGTSNYKVDNFNKYKNSAFMTEYDINSYNQSNQQWGVNIYYFKNYNDQTTFYHRTSSRVDEIEYKVFSAFYKTINQ